jgi:hypothetical protein
MNRRWTSFILPLVTVSGSVFSSTASRAGDWCAACQATTPTVAVAAAPTPTSAPTLAPPLAVPVTVVAPRQDVTLAISIPRSKLVKAAAKPTPAPTPAKESSKPAASHREVTVAVVETRRQEVPAGARITLFANFLGKESGVVLLQLEGTSMPCSIVDWRNESVTMELPKLSLKEPKKVDVVVIRAEGRIAKRFPVLLVNQPDVLVHPESVPQPSPPLAPAEASTEATMAE